MRLRWKSFAAACAGLLFTLHAHAAHTQAALLLDKDAARPGETVTVAVRLKMDAHWHTYWRNSGESGSPTKITWQLPPGITAGEIGWPVPEKIFTGGVTTYGYNDETYLIIPLTLASNLAPGAVTLKAKVSWLECSDICVPAEQEVSATLNVGDISRFSPDSDTVLAATPQVPHQSFTEDARWEGFARSNSRTLLIEWESKMNISAADFFPFPSDDFEVSPKTELLPATGSTNHLRVTVTKFGKAWPARLQGLVTCTFAMKQGQFMAAGEVDLPLEPLNAPAINNQTGTAAANSGSLWQMLVFAFLGGLILNFMPCVLPVIALKILGFVNQSNENPKRVRQLGLVYGAGVLASFLALAGLVIAVQAAGHKAGWGMQFQSPVFVVALAALVTLVALNLFGVFEFNLGGGALDAAGKLSSRHGASGAFFNGVLMTLLATPCTAPFLAPALGFAFAQPAAVVVLFFLTIGAGLALPYVALSRQPAWLKFLPKPGAWMEKFKIAMGFPMLATVVWLCDVASAYYGERTWWLGVFLVVLALAAWVFGEFVQRGRAWKGFARIAVFILVAAGFGFILENELRWRTALEDMGDVPLQQSADGIAWQKWSAAAVNEARLAGHPVLVDFTAKWCTTCRVNKATSLEIPSVRAKLKEMDAVALLGDYTKFSADIAAELARFGRPGVPLVLVYPADVSQPPQVLPALLTPGIVLEALNKSAPAESKHK